MSVREDQIVQDLSRYIHEHPDEQMALMPVYDAARDHAQRGTCTHSRMLSPRDDGRGHRR